MPLGMYMIASFLLGLATLLPALKTPGMECKKGSATAAPLAFRNFLLEKFVRFNMTSKIPQKNRLLRYGPIYASESFVDDLVIHFIRVEIIYYGLSLCIQCKPKKFSRMKKGLLALDIMFVVEALPVFFPVGVVVIVSGFLDMW